MMPSTSSKQASFMQAVAKNPKFAKKVGVPVEVGAEFVKEDKRKRTATRPTMQKVNRRTTSHGAKSKLF
jgi:hypothetical protein